MFNENVVHFVKNEDKLQELQTTHNLSDEVWHSIVALCLLQYYFLEDKKKWKLVAIKAKKYLMG